MTVSPKPSKVTQTHTYWFIIYMYRAYKRVDMPICPWLYMFAWIRTYDAQATHTCMYNCNSGLTTLFWYQRDLQSQSPKQYAGALHSVGLCWGRVHHYCPFPPLLPSPLYTDFLPQLAVPACSVAAGCPVDMVGNVLDSCTCIIIGYK